MNYRVCFGLAAILVASSAATAADGTPSSDGEKTAWHGFDRHDFLMEQDTFGVKPIKAAGDERNGVKGQVKGQWRCVVVVPKESAPGKPWSWRGCYWDHEPQTEIELQKRGFHIGFIMADPGKPWDAVYTLLTDHGFSSKPVMEGAGTAAGEAYAWAIENRQKVSCIYGENPALRSLMSKKAPIDHLAPLAKARVPLIHVCGSLDPWLNDQTRVVEKRYKALGGPVTVIIKEGEGHDPLAPRDPKVVVDLIARSASDGVTASH